MLEILLLGAFDLRRDGESLCAVWRRHADRLLALLILNRNRALRDDWVVTALGIPESALAHAVSELYRVLGDDRARLRHSACQLYFDADGVDVDAVAFDRLVAKGDRDSLERAVALFRGGLLKGWAEAGWFSEEHEALLVAYLDALDTLSNMSAEEGRLDRAAAYLRRYVETFPEMDAAWARLVDLYARAGETAAVAQTRDRYLQVVRARREQGMPARPSQRVLDACARALDVSARALDAPASSTLPPPSMEEGRESRQAYAATYAAEQIGGAVPLDSPLYVERPADGLAHAALSRKDSFILVRGARQAGKSSLLARLARDARGQRARVVRTDLHKSPRAHFETPAALLADIANTFAEHLDMAASARAHFSARRAPTQCFEAFLVNAVFPKMNGSLVWIVDGTDRLFECEFRDDVFGMLRSWHNERADDLDGKWQLLTVVLAYATEPYLFIANEDQSPFNVGARIDLEDFTLAQVGELNRLYGEPLASDSQVASLYDLVGGHPYLVRRCLQEMALRHCDVSELERSAAAGLGPCRDHLTRLNLAIQRDPRTVAAVKSVLSGSGLEYERFVSLRAAGVLRGGADGVPRFRCRLYEIYLTQALS
jgi:DNA-binding SARP family transcriptional activator